MSTGVFPNHMKLAMIAPVYKGGSKLDISNYQPVSCFPILSKVLEKIVQVRLIKFLNKHTVLQIRVLERPVTFSAKDSKDD